MWVFIVFLLVLVPIVAIVFETVRNGGNPPMPSMPRMRRRLLEILPREVHGTVVDLGSGWGDLVLDLAAHYPHNRVMGLERSWFVLLMARLRIWLLMRFRGRERVGEIAFRRQDIFRTPWPEAGLVVCYLVPATMERLATLLPDAAAPGTWVASINFRLPGWQPVVEVAADDLYRTAIYLYRIQHPDQISGKNDTDSVWLG